MNEDLRILLGLYFSTTMSSILMNSYVNIKVGREAKKESIRKLKYRKGLSSKSKKELMYIDYYILYDVIVDSACSCIPGINILFTLANIEHDYYFLDKAKQLDDEIIGTVNAMEDSYRRINIDLLKSVRNKLTYVPEDLNIDDEEVRLSKKETKLILRKNKLSYKKILKDYMKESEV